MLIRFQFARPFAIHLSNNLGTANFDDLSQLLESDACELDVMVAGYFTTLVAEHMMRVVDGIENY